MSKCIFCDEESITKNEQGFSVCKNHKDKYVEIKCPICKSWMDTQSGKFGTFAKCYCGYNLSQNKIKYQILRS